MRNLFFTVVVIVTVVACTAKDRRDSLYIPSKISDIEIEENIFLEEWVDSVKYVPLETNDSCLIEDITQACYVKGRWVIFDYMSQAIYLFNQDGSFIRKVGNRGRGAEEYLRASNIMVDNTTGDIVVYSSGRVLYYTNDGNFKKSVTLNRVSEYPIRNIGLIDDGHFICYTYDYSDESAGVEGSGVWELDADGNFIRSYCVQNPTYPVLMNLTSPYITTVGDENEIVYIRDAIFSNIYAIQNGKIDTLLCYTFNESEYKSYAGERLYNGDVEKGWYIPLAHKSIVGGKWIFTYWDDQIDNSFVTLYNIETRQNRFTCSWCNSVGNKIQVIPNSMPVLTNMSNAMVFVASYETPLLGDYIGGIDKNFALGKLLSERSEDDNPILQVVYTK